jgi:hypothetical protein
MPITNQATPIVARLVGTSCISSGSEAIRTSGTSAIRNPERQDHLRQDQQPSWLQSERVRSASLCSNINSCVLSW